MTDSIKNNINLPLITVFLRRCLKVGKIQAREGEQFLTALFPGA
jgi:hypothetical protein